MVAVAGDGVQAELWIGPMIICRGWPVPFTQTNLLTPLPDRIYGLAAEHSGRCHSLPFKQSWHGKAYQLFAARSRTATAHGGVYRTNAREKTVTMSLILMKRLRCAARRKQ
jgi:hypothetical protein